MLEEFKKFIARGNVFDLAVGIIVGGAFGKIVSSFVSDILMPPIGLLLEGVNFTDLFITLKGGTFTELSKAKEAGAVTINYGVFLTTMIDFLIISFVIFMLIRTVNRLTEGEEEEAEPEPTSRDCPYCKTKIAIDATRCPNCTSQLEPQTA